MLSRIGDADGARTRLAAEPRERATQPIEAA